MEQRTSICINTIFVFILLNSCETEAKRGPHHPRSELSKTKTKIDQHLSPEEHHHLDYEAEDRWGVDLVNDMLTDEAKHFYYFKVHDRDNNNALDGLELLQAAMHQDGKNSKTERDTFLQNATDELDHIIEVIDDFLDIADVNKDGLLYYPEYMKAVIDSKEISQELRK